MSLFFDSHSREELTKLADAGGRALAWAWARLYGAASRTDQSLARHVSRNTDTAPVGEMADVPTHDACARLVASWRKEASAARTEHAFDLIDIRSNVLVTQEFAHIGHSGHSAPDTVFDVALEERPLIHDGQPLSFRQFLTTTDRVDDALDKPREAQEGHKR